VPEIRMSTTATREFRPAAKVLLGREGFALGQRA